MREKNRSKAHGRVVESSRRRMEENYCEMHRYERYVSGAYLRGVQRARAPPFYVFIPLF